MKKILCLLLSMFLLVSMAGCGAKEPAPTEPSTEATTESTTEPTTESTTLPTEPPSPPQHSGLREDGRINISGKAVLVAVTDIVAEL